jgi:hypothetical protein
MSQQYIVNAAPMVIDLGISDKSTVTLPREQEALPQHLPKFYIYAQKGPSTPQLLGGNERITMYGSKTFDLNGKYTTHATVFTNKIAAEGNTCMYQRIYPNNCKKASFTLWINYAKATYNKYKRNVDGSFVKKDDFGNYEEIVPAVPVNGIIAEWIVTTNEPSSISADKFGENTLLASTLNGAPSLMYPIMDLEIATPGEYGNDIGFRLWAPTDENNSVASNFVSENLAYPYRISVVKRTSVSNSVSQVYTTLGERELLLSFKPGIVNVLTAESIDFQKDFLKSYQNLDSANYPAIYGDFGRLAFYKDNFEKLLTEIFTLESANIGYDPLVPATYNAPWYDFITGDINTELHIINPFTGASFIHNVPYETFRLASSGFKFNMFSHIFAGGGNDGDISDDNYDKAVSDLISEYDDPNSELQELAINVESIFYDTGFSHETKRDLVYFISQRHDTFLVLSTYAYNQPLPLDVSEEYSLGTALRTYLQNYRESDYFGTPLARAMIMGRSGYLRNSTYKKPVPTTLELAIKSARYMGSNSGKWLNGFNFDSAPNNILDNLYNINITWVPASVRNTFWDSGINWVQAYDRKSYMFPALRTVYDDDTSVLSSYFTVMAICYLNKIAHASWRDFTGISHFTNDQLVIKVNDFITSKSTGIFDNRFTIVPSAYVTEMDKLRGYSITIPIKIYAANMKTVATVYIESHRIDDLTTA